MCEPPWGEKSLNLFYGITFRIRTEGLVVGVLVHCIVAQSSQSRGTPSGNGYPLLSVLARPVYLKESKREGVTRQGGSWGRLVESTTLWVTRRNSVEDFGIRRTIMLQTALTDRIVTGDDGVGYKEG